MYLHCKSGFFEVDRFQNVKVPGPYQQPMKDAIIVRARKLEYLVRLRDQADVLCEILHTPEWDYPYRMYLTQAEFSYVMVSVVEDLDYQNFKKWAGKNAEYQRQMALEIWEAGYDNAKAEPKRDILKGVI